MVDVVQFRGWAQLPQLHQGGGLLQPTRRQELRQLSGDFENWARGDMKAGPPRSLLLIIVGLGYLPLEPNAAYLFFHLIPRRSQRSSMLITSNRPFMA